jgi:galactokinase
MAKLGQRAENEWVGMNCGIMDQMISSAAPAVHALQIDCRSLETWPVPLPPGMAIVVLDTATRRGLLGSASNERRAQCEGLWILPSPSFQLDRKLQDRLFARFDAYIVLAVGPIAVSADYHSVALPTFQKPW